MADPGAYSAENSASFSLSLCLRFITLRSLLHTRVYVHACMMHMYGSVCTHVKMRRVDISLLYMHLYR